MKRSMLRWIVMLAIVGSVLALTLAALASGPEAKGYAEGEAGTGASTILQSENGKDYAEGTGGSGTGVQTAEPQAGRTWAEGEAGRAGRATLTEGRLALPAGGGLDEIFWFSGVSDDGAKGGAGRSEATSVHCTNLANSDNQVEVRVYTYNALQVFTATINIPPDFTFTYSTQNTTIYFDDMILGGGAGTDAIFQGSGVILAESPQIICTAQVLDPLNGRPEYVVGLDLFKR